MDKILDIYEDVELENIFEILYGYESKEERRLEGSRPGRAENIERNRDKGASRPLHDYFSTSPTYSHQTFAFRFCVLKKKNFSKSALVMKSDMNYFSNKKMLQVGKT